MHVKNTDTDIHLRHLFLSVRFDILEFRESDVSPDQKKQSNKANLYPWRRVILEKLINHKA